MPSTYNEYTAYENYSQQEIVFPFLDPTDVKIYSSSSPITGVNSNSNNPVITNWTYVSNQYYNNSLNNGVSQLPFGNYSVFFENGVYLAKFPPFGSLTSTAINLINRPATIFVYRNTNRSQVFNFVNGASIQADDLNKAYNQTLFLAQEVKDLLDRFGGEANLASLQSSLNDKISKYSPETSFETQEISVSNQQAVPLTISNKFITVGGIEHNAKALDVKGGMSCRGTAVFSRSIDLNNQQIKNIAAPVNSNDVATKAYVDAVAQPVGGAIPEVSDGSITTAKLRSVAGEEAVANGNIRDSAVTSSKLALNSVINSKIASNAVTEAKINSGAVTTTKISDGAITLEKLNNNFVLTGNKIQNSNVNDDNRAITTDHIKNSSITSDKIQNQSVTLNKLANGIITNDILPNPLGINKNSQVLKQYIGNSIDPTNSSDYLPFNNKKQKFHFIQESSLDINNYNSEFSPLDITFTAPYNWHPSYQASSPNMWRFNEGSVVAKLEHTNDATGDTHPIWRFYIRNNLNLNGQIGASSIYHLVSDLAQVSNTRLTPYVTLENWTAVPLNLKAVEGLPEISFDLNSKIFNINPIQIGANVYPKYNIESWVRVNIPDDNESTLWLWTRFKKSNNDVLSYGEWFGSVANQKHARSNLNLVVSTPTEGYFQYYADFVETAYTGPYLDFFSGSDTNPVTSAPANHANIGFTNPPVSIPHGNLGSYIKITRVQ